MDRSRSLKRQSDGEPSESSKRQHIEGHASGGFASGPAGRDHLRFTGTATLYLNLDIESLFKEIEQRQGIATQRHKAHDQAGSSQQGREVRLFGVNIADGLKQQEASSGRQAEQDLEQRLGQQQGQESTILAQQTEVSQANSSRQPFGWQGQEAFHTSQLHQEIGPSSQQDVINEPMPLEISSDSDSESNHARPFVIRETSHERIHHQAGPSHQGDLWEKRKRKKGGIAFGEKSSHRGHGVEKLTEDLMKDPYCRAEIEKQIREI